MIIKTYIKYLTIYKVYHFIEATQSNRMLKNYLSIKIGAICSIMNAFKRLVNTEF